jgi:uncharacterized protein (DUF58 family)
MKPIRYIADLFLLPRFFWSIGCCIFLFVISFYFVFMWPVAIIVTIVFFMLLIIDYSLLFFKKNAVVAKRIVEYKWSNGDENEVELEIENNANMKLNLQIIDEVPFQFQYRNFKMQKSILGFSSIKCSYQLRPVARGQYRFGSVLVFAASPLGWLQRRYQTIQHDDVKVYPSFLQIRNKSVIGIANLKQEGNQKLTKLANSTEFNHIKEYVQGDDIRTINWKASARNNQMMVNTFSDERSQQIYCVLDMGRVMKMPFNGMSLLDYAINASLLLSFSILHKNDKAGIITFNNKLNDVLKASKSKSQLTKVADVLYKQNTQFQESNYEALMQGIKYHVGQRSLIMLFTNFETMNALDRHLAYLKSIAKKHLLCVVIFENKELKNIHQNYADTMEGIYVKTIADRFDFEKKRIIKELKKEGILSIFTTPEKVTLDTINQYVTIKKKRMM